MKNKFKKNFSLLDWIYSIALYTIILIILPVSIFAALYYSSYIRFTCIFAFLLFPRQSSLICRNIFSRLIFFLWRLLGIKIKFIGLENLPKEKCILASNHFFPDMFFIHLLRWDLTFVSNEYGSLCMFIWDIVFVRRNKKNPNFLKNSVKAFKTRSICIYPEGDLIPSGLKARYHRGVAILARELNCKVIPITHNFGEILSGPSLLPAFPSGFFCCIFRFRDRNKLWIKVHPPVTYNSLLSQEFPEIDESSFRQHCVFYDPKRPLREKLEKREEKNIRNFADRLQIIIESGKERSE